MLLLIAAASASEWAWTGSEPGFPPSTDPLQVEGCTWSIADDHLTTLRCEGWVRQSGDFVGGAALVVEGDRLVVATFSRIATGAKVTVYDKATGQERWTRSLTGLGPIGHSEYHNAVQLRVAEDRVEVFGWEAGGRYIEHLALDTGTELGLWHEAGEGWEPQEFPSGTAWTWVATRAPPPVEAEWAWDPELTHDLTQEVYGDDHRCGRVWKPEEASLWCGTADGTVRWQQTTGTWSDAAAIATEGEVFYVVRFHPIATGATAYAYRVEDGQELWRQGLWGRGPVTHSKYRNEVQVRVDGDRLVVYGQESDGRYVEVLDRKTGRPLGHRAID